MDSKELEDYEQDTNMLYDLLKFKPIQIIGSTSLTTYLNSELSTIIDKIRSDIARIYGFILPVVEVTDCGFLNSGQIQVFINEAQTIEFDFQPDKIFKINCKVGQPVEFYLDRSLRKYESGWVDEAADDPTVTYFDPDAYLEARLFTHFLNYAESLFTRQATANLIDKLAAQHPFIVEALQSKYPFSGVSVVHNSLAMFLSEKVSIRSLSIIIEGVLDYYENFPEINDLVEMLRRDIVHQLISRVRQNKPLTVLALYGEFERSLALKVKSEVPDEELLSRSMLAKIKSELELFIERLALQELPPVLICSPIIRRKLRDLFSKDFPDLNIISFNEIRDDVPVDLYETLGLPNKARSEMAANNKLISPKFSISGQVPENIKRT
tara:strand:+ start:1055 stop:2197 length:1143 start_codon:yes stop_codon:yes gene_type:complete